MAVVAGTGLDADFVLEIRLRNVLVAIEGDESSGADGDRVGAQGQCLGDVGAVADAARVDQRYLARFVDVVQGLARLGDGVAVAGGVGVSCGQNVGSPIWK